MKKLFLLDAYALIYRAHFAFIKAPRITSKGLNTSAVFGFTNVLLDVLQKEKPTHIAIVYDTHAPTFRHIEYESYKANRDETPEDIKIAVPYIKKLAEGFRIPFLGVDGFEADDVIGTLAQQAAKENFTVYMMTPDKDFGQLVTEQILQYKPSIGGKPAEVLGVKEICEKWDIDSPLKVIDILGLMGDAVDNIPGIPGFGEKTAIKLIKEYGSVEGLIQNTDKLKGKQLELIKQHADKAILSKHLATIATYAPITFDAKQLELEPVDVSILKPLFEELEFRTLSKRIFTNGFEGENHTQSGGATSPQKQDPMALGGLFGGDDKGANPDLESETHSTYKRLSDFKFDYQLVSTLEERKALADLLYQQKSIAFDTETSSLIPNECIVVGFSFSFQPLTGYYVPFNHDIKIASQEMEVFKQVLEDENIEKIGSNIKFDLSVIRKYGINLKGNFFDTMLAHYLIEPDMRHGMDTLAENYLSYKPISYEEVVGKKGKLQKTMLDFSPEHILNYAAEDCDVVFQLKEKLLPLLKDSGTEHLYHSVEAPLLEVLADMELEGVRLDTDALKQLSIELKHDLIQLEKDIYQLAGEEFNINSPAQLGQILFIKLQLDPKAKKTSKTKQFATGEDVLQGLVHKHPIAEKIIEYRELTKLKSTYVDSLPLLISKLTGRIHTTFQQAVAATGRLSSIDPNLQNIPIRTERGREIRKAFISRDEHHILLSADYSQIELRLIAEMSGEENMLSAFKNGLDIHAATASRMFKVDLQQVTSDMRRSAKTVNFGIIYGISVFGLSQRLGVSRTEAAELIRSYNEQYPGIKQYMVRQIQYAKEHGFVMTILGRRRYLRDINSANAVVRGFAERNAINAPIQGSAADMIKIAMINIHKAMQEKGFKAKMILQVHDELLFDTPINEVGPLRLLVTELMRCALPNLSVPIEVETGTGKNWLEAH